MEAVLGYVVAMVLSMIAAGGFWVFAQHGIDQVKDSSVAQQAQIINDAAVRYVQDNASALTAIATPTIPASITIPALACAGYLPVSYQAGVVCPAPAWPTSSTGIKNGMNQNWLLQVTQPTAGKLQAAVISMNGIPYTLKQSGRLAGVAAAIGAQGGFVPYTGQGGDATLNAANAQGSYGGWSIANLAASGYANPGSGHFVSLLSFRSGQSTASTLYRASIAGQPQLNTMNTPVVMNAPQTLGGACTAPGAIANDSNGGFLMCQNTSISGLIWANFVAQPVASTASLPACGPSQKDQIVMVQNPNGGATAPSVYACTGAPTGPTSGWWPIGVDASGNLSLPGTLATAGLVISGSSIYNGRCATSGGVTIGPNGMLLSCQSGFWSQTGQVVGGTGTVCGYPGMIARDINNNLYICN